MVAISDNSLHKNDPLSHLTFIFNSLYISDPLVKTVVVLPLAKSKCVPLWFSLLPFLVDEILEFLRSLSLAAISSRLVTDGSQAVNPKTSLSHSFGSSDMCLKASDVINASWWRAYIWNSFNEQVSVLSSVRISLRGLQENEWDLPPTPMHLDRPTLHLFGPYMLCLIITQKAGLQMVCS